MTELLGAPGVAAALEELGAGLEMVGRGLRSLAASARDFASEARQPEVTMTRDLEGEAWSIQLLMKRLGPANAKFLMELAEHYEPGDSFTLEDVAHSLGTTRGSARARMANIGRSLRALGGRAPDLWDKSWEPTDRMNYYEWNHEAHVALRLLMEGV